jgi:predicted permease
MPLTWSDPKTVRFAGMVGLVVAASAAGYLARKLKWCPETAAERLTWLAMVYVVPLASMLPVWNLRMGWEDVWLPIQCVILTFLCLGLGLWMARRHGLSPEETGAYSYAAAHANIGVTMGGFVCLALFGEKGLALSLIYLTLWTMLMFGVFFPLAGAFAGQSVRFGMKSFLRSLLDIRCISLPAIFLGLGLYVAGVNRPAWIEQTHLVDVLVCVNNAAMFFVIGLTLHLSRIKDYAAVCLSLSAIRFLASPAAAIGLILLARAAGLHLDPLRINVMLVESAMPTAVFAVVAASLYNLNVRLASLLFVVNTAVFLALVLPIIMALPWKQ